MDKTLAVAEIDKALTKFDDGILSRVDFVREVGDILDVLINDVEMRSFDEGMQEARDQYDDEDEYELDIDLDEMREDEEDDGDEAVEGDW